MPLELHYASEQHLFVSLELPAAPALIDRDNIK